MLASVFLLGGAENNPPPKTLLTRTAVSPSPAPPPQGGAIKLYKSLACPLDGYELLLFSLSGHDGKTYPLYPFCYSNPPFEGVMKVWACGPAGAAPGAGSYIHD